MTGSDRGGSFDCSYTMQREFNRSGYEAVTASRNRLDIAGRVQGSSSMPHAAR